MNSKKLLVNLLSGMLIISSATLKASDHDDGVTSIKPQSRNLTDLFVFRQDQQTGISADNQNMILIMNSSPRSPGGVQRYFNTNSTYEFHITALGADEKNSVPTGRNDEIIQFKFNEPDQVTHVQKFSMYLIKDGKTTEITSDEKGPLKPKMQTTNIINSTKEILTINHATYDNNRISIFAGLREDPFFFDVDQFFKVRMGALGEGPKVGFRSPATAVDFTIGYNVNTIVVQLPIAFLGTGTNKPIFDVWETVTSTTDKVQVERLARPAINEGLVVTNDFLNGFNMIPPSADLSAAAAPVVNEAANTIVAFDMLDGKMDTTVAQVANAFLPDVMRVDSRLDIAVGMTAYNSDVSGDRGMLTGGRKLEDDVMDITLSFLVAGDATGASVKDNVSYEGTPGNKNQGHKFLYQQATRKGPASFPFLAKPN